MIQYHLQKLGLDAMIIYKLEKSCQTDQSLYLIIHNDQSTIWMPPRYIMWQIEQTDISNNSLVPKFNERYFQDLQNSICVFEMSRDNIKFYQKKFILHQFIINLFLLLN